MEVELRKFSEKKTKTEYCPIRTHAHSFDDPVQLPLGHQPAEFCLNYFFIIQLTLTSPNPNSREFLALPLTLALALAIALALALAIALALALSCRLFRHFFFGAGCRLSSHFVFFLYL